MLGSFGGDFLRRYDDDMARRTGNERQAALGAHLAIVVASYMYFANIQVFFVHVQGVIVVLGS